jgi:hypothetical protein
VPFALSGGIYLLYALGYNFSVAVWVGFIALFGTAVQTGMVMVIYLDEAVVRKRETLGGALTPAALLEAVTEGALLRLRPKVMTVTTVVAGLLPIMWSHSAGAEVMKPLATPVLGGMVSSLVLVLIVTPVLFYWLRMRELRRAATPALGPAANSDAEGGPSMTRRRLMVGLVLLSGIAGVADAAEPKPIHMQKTKEAVITLANEAGQLKVGKNTFTLTFADPATGKPLDVGTVAFETSMAMPGMAPMLAGATVTRDATPGRYLATITFPDAGARQVTLRWDGPAGKGTARFSVSVR